MSAIAVADDNVSYAYKRKIRQKPERRRTADVPPSQANQSSRMQDATGVTQHSTMNEAPQPTEQAPEAQSQQQQKLVNSEGQGDNCRLLDGLQLMLDKHVAVINDKLSQQHKELNDKIEVVSKQLKKLSAERQKQLDIAGALIDQGMKETQSMVTNYAFQVLECVRQAAQGNVGSLMDFALKITPDHLRPAQPGPLPVPKDLQAALTNLIVPAPEKQ